MLETIDTNEADLVSEIGKLVNEIDRINEENKRLRKQNEIQECYIRWFEKGVRMLGESI